MTWCAGADGCRAGWVAVFRDQERGRVRVRVIRSLADVLEEDAPARLGIDIPIGLPDQATPGGRACDRAARALLGEPRARSVFSPPARPALFARTFEEALRLNRASSPHALGISRQCFHILPKIREVDAFLSPVLQERAFEVHPELSLFELNGRRPLDEPKKSALGLAQRVRLLERAWECTLSPILEAHRGTGVAPDDLADAMAACWTAERAARGAALRLPPDPPRDSRGLRMEILR